MSEQLLQQTWDALQAREADIRNEFFEILISRYPEYLDRLAQPELLEAMGSIDNLLEMVTWMEQGSEERIPYIARLGALFREQGIDFEDMDRFRELMLEVLDRHGAEIVSGWSAQHLEAWNEAFELCLIPHLLDSMQDAA